MNFLLALQGMRFFFRRKCRFLTDLKVKMVILEINADPKLLSNWFPPVFFLCQSHPCLFNQNVNISHISCLTQQLDSRQVWPWDFVFHKQDLNKLKWGEKKLCMHYFISSITGKSFLLVVFFLLTVQHLDRDKLDHWWMCEFHPRIPLRWTSYELFL